MVESEEVVLPLPNGVGTSSAVRSTLIQSSLNALRGRRLYDRSRFDYGRLQAPANTPDLRGAHVVLLERLEHLPAEYHELVLRTLAPTWLPMRAAVAHYTACDALGLSELEQVDIGGAVGQHIQHSFLQTIARTSQNLGVTPWIMLKQLHRLWDRTFVGGGCAVFKVGPKDARVDMHGLAIAGIPYFRNAWRGAFNVGLTIFSTRAFCKLTRSHGGPTTISYRVAWV